jgi:hypothetical protein
MFGRLDATLRHAVPLERSDLAWGGRMISRANSCVRIRAALLCGAACLALSLGLPGPPAVAGTLPAPSAEQAGAEQDAVPVPVARLVELVEAELGHPLAPGERTRCLDAGRRALAALREREMMFLHAVADLLRLEPAQVALMAPAETAAFDSDIRPKLEQVLGRRITKRERQRIRTIDEERLKALVPMRWAFAREIAEATGLPADSAAVLLPLAGM